MEFRFHGRGGQGAVTCAKILATVYARLGKSIQTFGDYAGERSGAPVRAYARVSDAAITNRNKVYNPDHLVVLDPSLLGEDVLSGLAKGGTLLLNTSESARTMAERFPGHRLATVDATAIARRHGIGSRSLVIVNTTIAGAFVRVHDIDLEVLERTYEDLGFASNFAAAKEAFDRVQLYEVDGKAPEGAALETKAAPSLPEVMPISQHLESLPTGLQTGAWSSQRPHYVEHLAPCNAFCPAGNDVVNFIQALEGEEASEAAAAEILGRTTPLAGVCGRVCPAPCMEGCNRTEYDGSVNIRGLERWIADHVPVAQKKPACIENPFRIAIVGSGPAGLSAAYTLALLGHKVTIYEGEEELGGVLRTGIPVYRLPRQALDREIACIMALGVEARCGQFLDKAGLAALEAEYDATILATGLQKLRGLDVEGAELEGIDQGIHFLHRVNLEGGVELEGHVVVFGGGNTAMDCARSALRAGAEKVTVAYRRTRQEMPAIPEEIDEAGLEGIQFSFLSQPLAFYGNGKISEVELGEMVLGEPDESGRRRPVATERSTRFGCDHAILALGQSADFSLLPEGWELQGEGERIHKDGKALRVFCSGDLATGDGTVTHAIGNGRRVAGLALRALKQMVEVFERPDRNASVPLTRIRLAHFPRRTPTVTPTIQQRSWQDSYVEVNQSLPSAGEAERCFSCGHCTLCDTCLVYCPEGIIHRRPQGYTVDGEYCKGCGVCVRECPRHAMEMRLQ